MLFVDQMCVFTFLKVAVSWRRLSWSCRERNEPVCSLCLCPWVLQGTPSDFWKCPSSLWTVSNQIKSQNPKFCWNLLKTISPLYKIKPVDFFWRFSDFFEPDYCKILVSWSEIGSCDQRFESPELHEEGSSSVTSLWSVTESWCNLFHHCWL